MRQTCVHQVFTALKVVNNVELVSALNGKIKTQYKHKPQRRPSLCSRTQKFAICIGHFPGSSTSVYLLTRTRSHHTPILPNILNYDAQHEAHESSLKLQKHSLDSSRLYERARELESENERLREEVIVLRDNPDDQPHQDTLRLRELETEYGRLRDQVACVFPYITTAAIPLKSIFRYDATE